MEMKTHNREEWILKLFSALVVFMVTYVLVEFYFEHGTSDYPYHAKIAEGFHFSELGWQIQNTNTYFMWSAMVGVLHRSANVTLIGASAMVTALTNVVTMYLILNYLRRKEPQIDNTLWLYFGVGVMFVGALYFPWINQNYYLGTWTPNPWHNPTNIMVKPFAVFSVILILDILEEEKADWKKHVALMIALFLSVIAKPSFLQGIAPALALYVVVEVIAIRRLLLRKYLFLATCFLPAVGYMLVQIWLTFYGENRLNEGVGVDFLKIENKYVDSAGTALIAGIAFPFFVAVSTVMIQKKQVLRNPRFLLMVCYLCSGWFELAFLFEKGRDREGDANFAWGYMLALFVAFVLACTEFAEIIYSDCKHREAVKKTGSILFGCHLLFGIWYVYKQFQIGNGLWW